MMGLGLRSKITDFNVWNRNMCLINLEAFFRQYFFSLCSNFSICQFCSSVGPDT